ncbi:DUF202 domain-containing protein [Rhodococcus sp. NPDC058532]|uniref:DUF202 domain-containing protein n=1 Tax=Rhodococcus sp. NPDC058532 TaxID=3346540 RepID=UPI003654B009
MRVDPGLQPERTTLSWVRSASALAALGAIYLRCVPAAGGATAAVGVAMLVGAGALLASAPRRHRRVCGEFARGRVRAELGGNVLLLVIVLVAAGAGAVTIGYGTA